MEPGEIDFGPYGLGSARTLQDYENYAGINSKLKLVQAYTQKNELPPNPEVYQSDEEWQQRALKDFQATIVLDHDRIPNMEDYDFWYVAVHDTAGAELSRNDLNAEQVKQLLAQEARSLTFTYRAMSPAHAWTVWPHSRAHGSMEKIEGQITD